MNVFTNEQINLSSQLTRLNLRTFVGKSEISDHTMFRDRAVTRLSHRIYYFPAEKHVQRLFCIIRQNRCRRAELHDIPVVIMEAIQPSLVKNLARFPCRILHPVDFKADPRKKLVHGSKRQGISQLSYATLAAYLAN